MTDFVAAELALMVQWIRERDCIRAKKAHCLPKPWTEDKHLRDFRWCNVRRMDDRVSVALLQRWYQHEADPKTALVAALLARLVNWPEALFEVTSGRLFSLVHMSEMREALKARAGRGEKVFTGAYVVPGVPGFTKVDSVCNLVERVAEQAHTVMADTMRGTWANLITFDGLGSFLAGQVVADLVNIKAGEAWADSASWAPLGPGSARGINRLLGRPKDQKVTQLQFEAELPALIGELKPLVLPLWEDRGLIAMDIQNCLCEFDKYRRLQLAEGNVRARYSGLPEEVTGSFWEALA